MPTPLHTPRVNNNDDTVRLTRVSVQPGAPVRTGDIVAEVETDKASFTVEADRDGYVLAVPHAIDDVLTVGSVLLWIGDTATEPVPSPANGHVAPVASDARGRPTLKAAQLLAQHGLNADEVPASGARLTVGDIETYLADRARHSEVPSRAARPLSRTPSAAADLGPRAYGRSRPLSTEERGMLRTVLWHRDEAVPGYVEIQYNTAGWDAHAKAYQTKAGLLVSPLLALMAYRLVQVAAADAALNSTIVGEERFVYDTVNLGMTVQSDRALYLAVVEGANQLDVDAFIAQLSQLQRRAIAHALRANELTGATIAFTSMARWHVSRHVPILPPHTSLIVAHAGNQGGIGTLGATYDHRVLTGHDVLSVLRALSQPEVPA